jgi:hypothetical protein
MSAGAIETCVNLAALDGLSGLCRWSMMMPGFVIWLESGKFGQAIMLIADQAARSGAGVGWTHEAGAVADRAIAISHEQALTAPAAQQVGEFERSGHPDCDS